MNNTKNKPNKQEQKNQQQKNRRGPGPKRGSDPVYFTRT